jgi:DNA mismatch endonuclease (patch repair protein)
MTDMFNRQERSRIMSRIRSRGNAATELRFVEILRKNKITGWRRGVTLDGNPDFVFPAFRVVVFIDGDFWHGNPLKFRVPKSNVAYWEAKIRGNQRRDHRISKLLRSRGWKVLRVWQSSLRNETSIVARMQRALNAP